MHSIEKRHFIIIIIMLISVLVLGISGFMLIEDLNFIDALYLTVISISTVGFETVHPLSDLGKLFTSFLIVISLGIFAYGVSTLTRYILTGVFRNYFKFNKVKKRIKKLNNHVIVCGYGRVGSQATKELRDLNEDVVVIDREEDIINNLHEESEFLYIHGDATQEDILNEARISHARALLTTFPNDADNLFVVLTAREMNLNLTIISRAYDSHSDVKLKRAGATNVIMPDKVGGQRMAKLVSQPDVVEFLEYIMLQADTNVSLEELSCRNLAICFSNKSIKELDVRNVSGANIVGLRTSKGNYIINPTPDVILTPEDKLFVLGTEKQIQKLKDIIMTEKSIDE